MRRQSRARRSNAHPSGLLNNLRDNVPLVLFFLFALISMFVIYQFYTAGSDEAADSVTSFSEEVDIEHTTSRIMPILKEIKVLPVTQRRSQSPGPVLIGLIAGHRESDSGTECQDGLTEVEVTSALTEELATKLKKMDIDVETLNEFDPLLYNYAANAVVAIHVDSCDYINDLATGFKIAGSSYTDSSQLSICIQQMYGDKTQLPYHPNSITPHMANYHAFNKISQGTPAAIIEVGFLNLDRSLLTEGSEDVVDGLVDGISCFLDVSR